MEIIMLDDKTLDEKINGVKTLLKKLESDLEYYENKSPGRDRVVSTLVRITSLTSYLEQLTNEKMKVTT